MRKLSDIVLGVVLSLCRYDFTTTFDVIVGKTQGRQKRFPVYHDLFTARSGFFQTARSKEPERHIHLEGEDPEVFSLYLNCVHSGIEALSFGGELLSKVAPVTSDHTRKAIKTEHNDEREAEETDDDTDGRRFEALIRLFLLADKLQDPQMMNMAIDEIVRMVEKDGLIPAHVNLVYNSTPRDSVLRKLFRDVYLHEAESMECQEFLKTHDLPADFWRDISLEYFNLKIEKDPSRSIREVYGLSIGKDKCADKCYYHQHDERHPPCV